MADENIITTESKSNPSLMQTSSGSISANVSHLIGFCALGLLGCFFLPWITMLFSKVSGFALTKIGGFYLSLWAIPFFCVLTFFAGITKTSQKNAAVFTGILPFAALGLGLAEAGSGIFKALEIGGYGSLVLGLLLIVLPSQLKE